MKSGFCLFGFFFTIYNEDTTYLIQQCLKNKSLDDILQQI